MLDVTAMMRKGFNPAYVSFKERNKRISWIYGTNLSIL